MFSKKFYTALVIVVLSSFAISSCKQEEASGADPNTLPLANFFVDTHQYRTIDGSVYAVITTKNNSAYSNRWTWSRPGSRSEMSGPIEFTTINQDSIMTHVYTATDVEQVFEIKLVAYYDMDKPDTTFTSNPCVRIIHVKIPEGY